MFTYGSLAAFEPAGRPGNDLINPEIHEGEKALVKANREPIARFEQKILATLARGCGQNVAEPFGEKA